MNESELDKLRTLPQDVTEKHISVIFEAFDLNLDPFVWRKLNALKDRGFNKEQVITAWRSLAASSTPPKRQCAAETLKEGVTDTWMVCSSPKSNIPEAQMSSLSTADHVSFDVMKPLESDSQSSYFQVDLFKHMGQTKPTQRQNTFVLQNVSCICCGRPYNVEKPYCSSCGQEYHYEAALSKHRRECNGKETKRAIKRGRMTTSIHSSVTKDTTLPLSTVEDQVPLPEHRFEESEFRTCSVNAAGPLGDKDSWSDLSLAGNACPQELHEQMDIVAYPGISEAEMRRLLGQDIQEPVMDGYSYYWYGK